MIPTPEDNGKSLLRIVAFDPGPHIGLASRDYLDTTSRELTPTEFDQVADGWVAWADVVVCEAFNITGARAQSSNQTIEQIGILRYLCARHHTRFVLQQPAESKGFDPKWEKQKVMGLYQPGPDHARSALRHLMLFMAKEVHGFKEKLLEAFNAVS